MIEPALEVPTAPTTESAPETDENTVGSIDDDGNWDPQKAAAQAENAVVGGSENGVAAETDGATADAEAPGAGQVEEPADTPSPFEEVYNQNPDSFANMPTAEFMDIVHEYRQAIHDAEEITVDANAYQSVLDTFDQSLEKAEEPAGSDTDPVGQLRAMFNATVVRRDPEAEEEFTRDFDAVREDAFDKSPRQIFTGYLELGQKYLPKVADSVKAARRKPQAILDRYKSDDAQSAASAVAVAPTKPEKSPKD